MQSLDPRVVWLWRLQALLRFCLVWGPAATFVGFWVGNVYGLLSGVTAGGGIALVGFGLAIAWPLMTYEAYGYALREHDLLLQQGVLFRRRLSVPHSRIQHVETRQGPIERLFGLSRILVFTASGIAADCAVPGLATTEAELLRDELARRGGDDGL